MNIYDCLARPQPFQRSGTNFWDDPHVSEKLLNAHLDPHSDRASRNPHFLDRSADWIAEIAPPDTHPDLLDLGCGPGLYAQRLADKGYRVTGIDFSRRAIKFAKQQAKQTDVKITYECKNYLRMTHANAFDAAILIYCDYGALSPEEGQTLLRKIRQSLRPGGKLLLDVFTMKKMEKFEEKQTWTRMGQGGFWRPDDHLVVQNDSRYDKRTTLEQTVVVANESIRSYEIWHRYFDKKSLAEELKNAGFAGSRFFGDVAGERWSAQSETIAVVTKSTKKEGDAPE